MLFILEWLQARWAVPCKCLFLSVSNERSLAWLAQKQMSTPLTSHVFSDELYPSPFQVSGRNLTVLPPSLLPCRSISKAFILSVETEGINSRLNNPTLFHLPSRLVSTVVREQVFYFGFIHHKFKVFCLSPLQMLLSSTDSFLTPPSHNSHSNTV